MKGREGGRKLKEERNKHFFSFTETLKIFPKQHLVVVPFKIISHPAIFYVTILTIGPKSSEWRNSRFIRRAREALFRWAQEGLYKGIKYSCACAARSVDAPAAPTPIRWRVLRRTRIESSAQNRRIPPVSHLRLERWVPTYFYAWFSVKKRAGNNDCTWIADFVTSWTHVLILFKEYFQPFESRITFVTVTTMVEVDLIRSSLVEFESLLRSFGSNETRNAWDPLYSFTCPCMCSR